MTEPNTMTEAQENEAIVRVTSDLEQTLRGEPMEVCMSALMSVFLGAAVAMPQARADIVAGLENLRQSITAMGDMPPEQAAKAAAIEGVTFEVEGGAGPTLQ